MKGVTISTWLRQLEGILAVQVTIKDVAGILVDEEGGPLFPYHKNHGNPWCTYKREPSSDSARLCKEHCNVKNIQWAAAHQGSFVTEPCYRGLVELAVPIYQDEALAFLIYAGMFRPENPCAGVGAWWKTKIGDVPNYEDVPNLRSKSMGVTETALRNFGYGVLYKLSQRKSEPRNSRQEMILSFIQKHYRNKVSLMDLGLYLHLSPSRARHVVQEEMQKGFRELLQEERVTRAKNLLVTTNLSLMEIAERTGFGSPFYFSRQFKKMVGVPPSSYRSSKGSSGLA